jgi:DNA topoisomerase-1
VSQNEQDILPDLSGYAVSAPTTPAPLAVSHRSPVREKVHAIAQRAGIAPDIADDFLKVTGGIESGNSHYRPNGSVKMSPPDPKDGQRAVGFSQIKPNTARSVDPRLDPMREDDNIELGLRYFAQGGSDPVARRIRYFGGGKSTGLAYYNRTGKIPPGGDFTGTSYRHYVQASGGLGQGKSGLPDLSSYSTTSVQEDGLPDLSQYAAGMPQGQTTQTAAPQTTAPLTRSHQRSAPQPVAQPTTAPLMASHQRGGQGLAPLAISHTRGRALSRQPAAHTPENGPQPLEQPYPMLDTIKQIGSNLLSPAGLVSPLGSIAAPIISNMHAPDPNGTTGQVYEKLLTGTSAYLPILNAVDPQDKSGIRTAIRAGGAEGLGSIQHTLGEYQLLLSKLNTPEAQAQALARVQQNKTELQRNIQKAYGNKPPTAVQRIVQAASETPIGLAKAVVFSRALGPVAGFAAMGLLDHLDEGPSSYLWHAGTGALTGGALRATEGLGNVARVGFNALAGGATTAADQVYDKGSFNGDVDPLAVAQSAVTQGILSIGGGREGPGLGEQAAEGAGIFKYLPENIRNAASRAGGFNPVRLESVDGRTARARINPDGKGFIEEIDASSRPLRNERVVTLPADKFEEALRHGGIEPSDSSAETAPVIQPKMLGTTDQAQIQFQRLRVERELADHNTRVSEARKAYSVAQRSGDTEATLKAREDLNTALSEQKAIKAQAKSLDDIQASLPPLESTVPGPVRGQNEIQDVVGPNVRPPTFDSRNALQVGSEVDLPNGQTGSIVANNPDGTATVEFNQNGQMIRRRVAPQNMSPVGQNGPVAAPSTGGVEQTTPSLIPKFEEWQKSLQEPPHHSQFQPRRQRGDGKGQFKKGKPELPQEIQSAGQVEAASNLPAQEAKASPVPPLQLSGPSAPQPPLELLQSLRQPQARMRAKLGLREDRPHEIIDAILKGPYKADILKEIPVGSREINANSGYVDLRTPGGDVLRVGVRYDMGVKDGQAGIKVFGGHNGYAVQRNPSDPLPEIEAKASAPQKVEAMPAAQTQPAVVSDTIEVGPHGRFSSALRRSYDHPTTGEKLPAFLTEPSVRKAVGLPEVSPDEAKSSAEMQRTADAIAQNMRAPRSSHLGPNGFAAFIKRHADKLSTDAVDAYNQTVLEHEGWNRKHDAFLSHPEVERELTQIENSGNARGALTRLAKQGKQYGISQEVVRQHVEEAKKVYAQKQSDVSQGRTGGRTGAEAQGVGLTKQTASAGRSGIEPKSASTTESAKDAKDKSVKEVLARQEFQKRVEQVATQSPVEIAKGIKTEVQGHRIKLNAEAYATLVGAYNNLYPNEQMSGFSGMFNKPAAVKRVSNFLDYVGEVTKGKGFHELADDIRRAARRDGTAIVYTDARALPHESFHRGEFLAGDHARPEQLYKDITPTAHRFFDSIGTSKDRDTRTSEFYAYLADPDFNNRQFGVSEDRADELLYNFATSLIDKNGPAVIDHFEEQADGVRQQLERARSEAIGRQVETNRSAQGRGAVGGGLQGQEQGRSLEGNQASALAKAFGDAAAKEIEKNQRVGKEKFLEGSAVKDVVHHGSNKRFNQFELRPTYRNIDGRPTEVTPAAFFFATDKASSKRFAKDRALADESLRGNKPSKPSVRDFHISVKKPLELIITPDVRERMNRDGFSLYYNSNGISPYAEQELEAITGYTPQDWNDVQAALDDPAIVDELKAAGYDGAHLLENDGAETWAVFEPNQIRSVNAKFQDLESYNVLAKRESSPLADFKLLPDEKAIRPGYREATPEERKSLKIPPAWTGVQISTDPHASLMAVGKDSKGRTQRLYSTAHTEAALVAKFIRQREFNSALPDLMNRIEQDMNGRNREEARVLRLIALSGFRVGGEADTGAKIKAYGASTLRAEHVKIEGDVVHFDFIGKLGVRQQHSINDAALVSDLRARMRRGDALFSTNDVKVRKYLHSISDKDFKVHDFRTWNATEAARHAIEQIDAPTSAEEYWSARDKVGDIAAEKIGDTRKIALESYIDPLVFEDWRTQAGVDENAQRPTRTKRKAGDVQRASGTNEGPLRDQPLRHGTGPSPLASSLSSKEQKVRESGRVGELGLWNPFGKRVKPEEYASITGAIKDVASKNLSQLKTVSPASFEAAMRFTGIHAQATAARLRGHAVTPADEQVMRRARAIQFVDALETANLLQPFTPRTQTIIAGGRTFTAGEFSWKGKRWLAPTWLITELKPFTETRSPDNIIKSIIGKVNSIGLAGPLDAAFHSANLTGTLIGTTPFVGTDIVSRTIGNTPATKWLTTIIHLARTNPSDAQAQTDIQEMARIGVVPNRWATESYSKTLAAMTGGEVKRFGLGPFLNGPKGLDIRSRLIMYRIAKHVNPNASDTEIADFVNQLGIYNRQLESAVSRAAKGSNLAPFFTAGSAMLKNSVKAWTGTTPNPAQGFKDRASFRFQQQFSGGVMGLLAMWIGASLLYRGLLPWKDKESKFLQIPLNKKDRESSLAKTIYGDNDKTAYVGMGFFSPLVERGARALGISGAYDTAMRGGSKTQMMEAGVKDAANTAIHPFTTGPALHASFIAVTGSEPQLQSMRDVTGKFSPTLRSAHVQQAKSGAGQIGRNLLAGGIAVNPFVHSITHNLGFNEQPAKDEDEDNGNVWLQTIMSLGLPRLTKGTSDIPKIDKSISKQEKAIETRARKADGRSGPALKPPSGFGLHRLGSGPPKR